MGWLDARAWTTREGPKALFDATVGAAAGVSRFGLVASSPYLPRRTRTAHKAEEARRWARYDRENRELAAEIRAATAHLHR